MAGPAPIIGLPGRLPLDAALEAAIGDWGTWLAHERRLSPHTLAAYGRRGDDFRFYEIDLAVVINVRRTGR